MITYMIAISFGILVFCLVIIRLSSFAEQQDQVKNRLNKVYNVSQRGVLVDEEFSKPLTERFIKPLFRGLIKSVQKYLPQDTSVKPNVQNKQANKMKGMLYQAGIKMDVNHYMTLRLIIIGVTGLIFGIIALTLRLEMIYVLFLVIIGFYAAYVVMRFSLVARISNRRNSMQKQLPEVLDMLSVSVEAGLGLEQAMIQVVNHFKGPLIDEIAVANREMAMGRNRKDALLLLGDRCEINEMKTFVRAIIQASQLGISIKNVLRSQASLMRQTRKNKVEEKAMKVSIKILLPMAFFIFPVLFIVLLGPAVAGIVENLL